MELLCRLSEHIILLFIVHRTGEEFEICVRNDRGQRYDDRNRTECPYLLHQGGKLPFGILTLYRRLSVKVSMGQMLKMVLVQIFLKN